jgi:PAS domain S-box-containing protein
VNWQITPFAVVYLLSAGLTALVGVFAWSRRSVSGALPFTFLLWAISVWTFFTALEYAVLDPFAKILFSKFQYIGISFAPSLFLIFALAYSRREAWLSKPLLIGLLGFPVITLLMAFTNDSHHLIWSKITSSSDAPGAYLIYEHGLWFWMHFAVTYIFMLVSTVVIIRTAQTARFVFRRQAWMLAASVILPWLGNVVYVFNLSPIPGLDWTPLGFTVSGVLLGLAILGFDLFNIVPVARDAVLDSMTDGVIVLDDMDRIADVNQAAQKMLKRDHNTLIGLPVSEAMPRWDNLLRALRESRNFNAELQPDSSARWFIEARVSEVSDRRKQNIGRAIVLRDITRRKDLERARDNLIHTMVHDLRNPLSSIVFSLDMIRQGGDLSEDASTTLEIASSNTERMLTLVNSILEIHRLESGELPLRREWSSLYSIAENRARAQTAIVREKKILLVNHVPDDLPKLLIDPTLVGRVIQNLLDNAIKFTPEGGLIEIAAETADDLIRVSIRDNGPGISESVRGRLFEKFATSGVQRGSGLGLAFCKQVIEAHGGVIGADAASRGTKFTFTLPLKN